eukprot:TRINITY_DN24948_c0_g1_i1.p1 TRINITY_DN24948_c0_g1~~TRINITY_DN24948_c0_g1_i1.p1  ORF type:complete len:337 (-),score=122.53 TRINITY_DN24948_c0_g1_i1:154-1092(-)
MAGDDELIIPIDKAFWPRGVLRGLMPLLRDLGDKHGNLVIAAVPNKHIMVKGPADGILKCKPGLLALFEEHFPDAPIPAELGGGGADDAGAAAAAEEEARRQAEEEAARQKAEAEAAKKAAEAKKPAGGIRAAVGGMAAKLTGKAKAKVEKPSKPPAPRKVQHPVTAVPSALLWECTRSSSSFLRNPNRQHGKKPFSAEPQNLTSFHCARFSGLASVQGLDVRPQKVGEKEAITLVQTSAKAAGHRRPKNICYKTGVSKCVKRGLKQIDTELAVRVYRKDLHELARTKYVKVQRTFKTKRPAALAKSRRSKK